MSRTVWKIGLPPPGAIADLMLPGDAKPLAAQFQGDTACMWIDLDPNHQHTLRHFCLFGTGWEIPPTARYIDTMQRDGFVWHLYEL